MLESLPEWAQRALTRVITYVPTMAAVLGILLGGWLVALIVRRAVFSGLKRTAVDQKAAKALGFKPPEGDRLERGVASGAYYLVLGLTAVVLFDHLDLGLVTQPIVSALEGVATGVPNLLKAALIGGVGFLAASLLRSLTRSLLNKTGLVERLAKLSLDEQEAAAVKGSGVAEVAGTVVFWLVLALTAIPVLEALRVGLLAEPLSAAFHSVSTFTPRIFAAAVLLLVGFLLARAARALVARLFDGLKLESKLKGRGWGDLLGQMSLGKALGSVAMAFIFLHFAISAVGRLGIPEVSEPLGLVLTRIYDYLPKLMVASLLLLVAVTVSRFVGRAAGSLLSTIGLNRLLAEIGIRTPAAAAPAPAPPATGRVSSPGVSSSRRGADPQRLLRGGPERTPAEVAGLLIGATVFLLFAQQVLETLELVTLSAMLQSFLAYLPNVLVAVCVLAAGMWAGAWSKRRVDTLTAGSGDRMLRSLGSLSHIAIVSIASMVALEQLGVAERLIAIAFALVLGASALAFALAFGLGGREAAGRLLNAELSRRRSEASVPSPAPGE